MRIPKKKRQHRNRLRQYRKRRHLTQKRLTYLLGHRSNARLSEWEVGRKLPTLRNALRLAYSLNTPVEYLFFELAREVQEEVNTRREQLEIRSQ